MNIQERLQSLIGAQAVQIVALQAEIETLQEQLRALQPSPPAKAEKRRDAPA